MEDKCTVKQRTVLVTGTLTAIPLVLSHGAVGHSVAHMLLAHALFLAAINRSVAAHVALELVRLIEAINVSVAPPIARNAAPLVTQKSRARRILFTLLSLNHLVVADALVRIIGLAK